jgi:hypothetical protein
MIFFFIYMSLNSDINILVLSIRAIYEMKPKKKKLIIKLKKIN